jgi:hypothetical protein
MTQTFLITGARVPAALHLARLLNDAGQRVLLADSMAHPMAARSAACARYVQLPSPRFDMAAYRGALQRVLHEEAVDLVIPINEEVFYLGQVWADTDMPCPLYAPHMDQLRETHNKYTFVMRAAAMGHDVPDTHLLQSSDDLDAMRAFAGDLVFKPVWSRFASQVLIRPDATKLDKINPTPAAPWVAQAYVAGEEICTYALASHGKLTALAKYTIPYRAGDGAGIYLVPVTDGAVREFVTRFVAETNWNGQISFDFIRTSDGSALPLECNPRATSGIHFFRDGHAFLAGLSGREILPDVTTPQTLPLAMWIFALSLGNFGQFCADLRQAGNVLKWQGDPTSAYRQLRSFAEIIGIALRDRISLKDATTRDIEWNGPDQSAMR